MENNVNCTVTEFEASGSLTECLGINSDRADFLIKQTMHALIDEDRFTAMVAKLSKFCKHPNELAFVAMNIGKIAAKQHSGDLGDFAQMFGRS